MFYSAFNYQFFPNIFTTILSFRQDLSLEECPKLWITTGTPATEEAKRLIQLLSRQGLSTATLLTFWAEYSLSWGAMLGITACLITSLTSTH